jgi:hypothetical protein
MKNAYTGDCDLAIEGWPAYRLRFDWEALAALQTQFGEQALKIVTGKDIGALLQLTAIGLQRHHPGITADDLRQHPPALAPLMVGVGQALALAYNGPSTGSGGSDAPNPPNRAARRASARQQKKKTRSPRR